VLAALSVANIQAAPDYVAPSLRGYSPESAKIQALEDYQLLALQRVRFAARDTRLGAEQRAALVAFAKQFQPGSNMMVEVRGYADGSESAAQNLSASTERATKIARFLTAQGVPAEQILILGLGEVDPSGAALNPEHQRVDVRLFQRAEVNLGRASLPKTTR
jgi:outer membrane protein OmpA-like peptidoglycan-associated protein